MNIITHNQLVNHHNKVFVAIHKIVMIKIISKNMVVNRIYIYHKQVHILVINLKYILITTLFKYNNNSNCRLIYIKILIKILI